MNIKSAHLLPHYILGLLVAGLIIGCAAPTPLPLTPPTVAATSASPPSATSQPTATPSPTPPPTATFTPAPTATATATPTDTPTPTPEFIQTQISTLNEHLGEEVTVVGKVITTTSFSQGFKFTLDDGSGLVTLLLWHNVYDDCYAAPQLNVGAEVRATGEVGEYQGELQVAPAFGSQVKVLQAGEDFAAEVAFEALGDYVGQPVKVTGEISNISQADKSITLFISAETETAKIFIWRTTLDRIPDADALETVGTRVEVVGIVQEYRGSLEIVPTLPYDVRVLAP
ncbi:MAG TPA: OB-fold nucleic acid binding domain-containing protein [Anaerolineae bacterium]|nr:OB-fold nucleic acid binding domain-containing protein [Anaerolineae bacterium]